MKCWFHGIWSKNKKSGLGGCYSRTFVWIDVKRNANTTKDSLHSLLGFHSSQLQMCREVLRFVSKIWLFLFTNAKSMNFGGLNLEAMLFTKQKENVTVRSSYPRPHSIFALKDKNSAQYHHFYIIFIWNWGFSLKINKQSLINLILIHFPSQFWILAKVIKPSFMEMTKLMNCHA